MVSPETRVCYYLLYPSKTIFSSKDVVDELMGSWRLLKESEFKDSEVERSLIKKCELNGTEYQPALLFNEDRLGEASSFWVKGLGHLTRELPKFEIVISELKDGLSFLQG